MLEKNKFLLGKDYQPMTVYHGTYYDFDYFRPLTHFGPRINAETNLKEGKWKRDPNIDINKPKIIPVYLSDYKYPEIPDLNDHSVKNWTGILFQYLANEQIKNFLNAMEITDESNFQEQYKKEFDKLIKATVTVPAEFDFICEPVQGNISENDIRKELSAETLFDIYNKENLFLQRMILYFESIGIHGFKYKNFTEGTGDYSYIIFRQNDIHRHDKKLPQYKSAKASDLARIAEIKTAFIKSHEQRVLSVEEKESLLNEIHEFYVFRFDEIKYLNEKLGQ